MVLSDEQLIERYLAGETEAFNALVKKWEKRIFNFALRYCGSREDAWDLSQEIFTCVFQRLEGLKDRRRFAPWVYKIALNRCRMRHRAVKNRQNLPMDAPELAESLELEASLKTPEKSANPEESFRQLEKATFLRAAIAELPEEQRVVLILKEYEELKFHEIADILDCPLSTVKSRLYLGFRALRMSLEQKGFSG